MKKGYFLLILLLLTGSMIFAQSITFDWIGLHGSGGTSDFTAEADETISVKVQYDATSMESIQGPYYSGTNHDKVRVYWYTGATPSGSAISSAGLTISNFSASGASGSNLTATFDFTMPSAASIPGTANSFQLMFGMYGENEDFDNTDGQRYSSSVAISGSYPLPSGSPDTGWQGYLGITTTTIETTITGTEVNIGQPLEGYQVLDWQPISYLNFVTNSGTAELSSITYTSSGTAASTDFQSNGFGIFWSDDATFSEASDTQLGTGQNFSSSMVFSGLSQEVTTTGGYLFCATRISTLVSATDKINLSVDSTNVVMDEDMNFGGCGLTNKFLQSAIYTDYQSNYTMGPGDNKPYFRLDIHTNSGATNLTQLSVDHSGTAIADDFGVGSFKIWHSTSSTFSATRATQLGTAKNYASTIQWTGLSQEVNATTSYIFFTATLDGDAVLSHVIKATIDQADVTFTGEYNDTRIGSYPLGGDDQGTTLPVELSAFTAVVTPSNDVNISWVTQSENGVSGYYIYRGSSSLFSDAGKFNAMITNDDGNNSSVKTYKFLDTEVINHHKYWYWLECVDIDGATHFFGPIIADLDSDNPDTPPALPLSAGLSSVYPNPFNPNTTVKFNLTEPGHVKMTVYDVRGRFVTELVNANYSEAGSYDVLWDGKNDNSKSVAGGVYFFKMESKGYKGVKKALLLK